ncbi:MAG: ABC transporter permease, partial [Chloroflexota bacterium]
MRGLLTKVWRDLTRRRVRSALTVLGIAVGVAGLVAIVSTARELTRAQRALYASTSQADITFWAWNAQAALAPLLEADPRIAAVELRVTYTTRWRVGDRWRDMELIGLDGPPRVNRFDILQGRMPLAGELLLDVSAARDLRLEPGAVVALRDPTGREREVRLSGISQSPGHLSSTLTNLDVGYVPAPTLRRLLDLPGSNQVLIALYDPTDAQRVAERVQRLFQRQRLQAGAPEIRTPDQFPGKRELDALIVVMFLFSGLGLVLSSTLVLNTLSASVAEQSDEIAVLKALGGTRRLVLALYLAEALAYGLVGTALGVGLGALLGWRLLAWIASLGNATVSFRLAPEGLALGVGVGLAVSLMGGWLPARQAARASVREALASYGIRSDYGQGWLDRRLKRLRGLPPLAAMALRNLSRRPARTAMTLLVIALATAGFLGALATRDAVNTAIEDIYATYATDAWVWLAEEVGTPFEGAFTTVEGVQ